jgi:hypothetical protein
MLLFGSIRSGISGKALTAASQLADEKRPEVEADIDVNGKFSSKLSLARLGTAIEPAWYAIVSAVAALSMAVFSFCAFSRSSSSFFSAVGQMPSCSYRSKKLELVGGDLRLMLVLRDRGSKTWDELFFTTRRGMSGEVGLLPSLPIGDESSSAHSAKACILGIGRVGIGGSGEVGAEAGSGGREDGEGKGKPETHPRPVLMLNCGVPLDELEDEE